jgi:hypothetical protein
MQKPQTVPNSHFATMQQAMGLSGNNFAAKPKLVNRAGPLAAGGGKMSNGNEYFSVGGLTSAMTRDPYREFV